MALFGQFVTNQPVSFAKMRRVIADTEGLQAGAVDQTSFRPVQRGAGANMSVDVGAGGAFVRIISGSFTPNLGHVVCDALANVVVPAANATNPRVDQLVLYWNDSSAGIGVGGDVPTLAILPGTATAGATLDNRSGVATIPNNCLRLADVLVPAASTSVVTANIRDRRTWARGANLQQSFSQGTNFTTASNTYSSVAQYRIELSGAPLLAEWRAIGSNNTAGQYVAVTIGIDGVSVSGEYAPQVYAANAQVLITPQALVTAPTAGSRVFQALARSVGGTVTLNCSAGQPFLLGLREFPGGLTAN